MSSSTQDRLTDRALRSLDPADPQLDDAQRHRADDLLARIVATDPGDPSREPTPRPTPRRRRRLLVAVALAAAVVASLAVPSLLGRQHAYASWKATPTPLTASQSDEAAAACRTRLAADAGGTGGPSRRQVAASRPVLAEQRGGWTYVALAGPGGLEGACLTGDSPDAGQFGFLELEPGRVSPGPERVVTQSSTSGTTSSGLFNYTEGYVGRDVSRVDIITATGLRVRASVANGRFAAWWPAGDDDMRNPEITEDHQVSWRLADGSRRGPVTASSTMH